MPKYVASRTLKSLTWANSHLLEGSLGEAVAGLKAEPGGDIAIHGSGGLINELLPHGLIDRFHILVYPLVLGNGKRLFRDGAQQNLKLIETKTFPKGVVAMIYDRVPVGEAPKPARNPVYGRK
jgi:dihydrofolate reductase